MCRTGFTSFARSCTLALYSDGPGCSGRGLFSSRQASRRRLFIDQVFFEQIHGGPGRRAFIPKG